MNARTRQARRIVRQRSQATRLTSSLKRGRAMATHMIAAGFDEDTVKGMATALKGVARRIGMEPAKRVLTRNTVDGKGGRKAKLRRVGHWTAAQVQTLLSAYKPRKAEYKAAKLTLAA
jgi:hypothetical protein